MILRVSTASLCSVCSSKHEAGRRSYWFEICIALASISCYSGFAATAYVREGPRVATRAWQRGGVDPFRRQVRKLGINALTALASELWMSVCGSHSMFCIAWNCARWQTWDQCIEGFSFWAGDVSVWQSFDGLQLAFGKTAWYCARWQTWDQCIEGFSFWAEDVSVWQSFDGLQLAFGKTAWYLRQVANLGSMHWRF